MLPDALDLGAQAWLWLLTCGLALLAAGAALAEHRRIRRRNRDRVGWVPWNLVQILAAFGAVVAAALALHA